jgi:hypothetical protein
MSNETPAQRRTRLIEQYVPQLLKLCQGEVMPPADQLINWASRLADAVIAATPQEQETPIGQAGHIERLERTVNALYTLCAPAAAIMRNGKSCMYTQQEWLQAWDAFEMPSFSCLRTGVK